MRGLVHWDLDGSLVKDNELGNQRDIQAVLDAYAKAAGRSRWVIDWSVCCGNSEDNIHRMVEAMGFHGLSDIVSPDIFRSECLQRFKELRHTRDLSAREDSLEMSIALRSFDIGSTIVSNNGGEPVHSSLKAAFEIADLGLRPRDVFVAITTKDHGARNQLRGKPAPDLFWYTADKVATKIGKKINRSQHFIYEDSPAGVSAANDFTNNPEQIAHFRDSGTPPQEGAGYHITHVNQTYGVIAARFDIPEDELRDALADVKRQKNVGAVRALRA